MFPRTGLTEFSIRKAIDQGGLGLRNSFHNVSSPQSADIGIWSVYFTYIDAFELRARIYGTDGRTDGRARRVMWPTGRPHITMLLYKSYTQASSSSWLRYLSMLSRLAAGAVSDAVGGLMSTRWSCACSLIYHRRPTVGFNSTSTPVHQRTRHFNMAEIDRCEITWHLPIDLYVFVPVWLRCIQDRLIFRPQLFLTRV